MEKVRYRVDRTLDGRIEFSLRMSEALWSHLAAVLLRHGSASIYDLPACDCCHELGVILRTKATGERQLPEIPTPLAGEFMPGT